MKQSNKGFDYSYNAQAVVDGGHQIIVAAEVTAARQRQAAGCADGASGIGQSGCGGDRATEAIDGTPTPIPNTADTGYFSAKAVDGTGEARHRPVHGVGRQKHHGPAMTAARRLRPRASVKEKMQHKLRSAAGKALYAARKHIVEPVFGQIKSARGIRQFLLRGLEKVSAEWQLICLTHNLLKIWRHTCSAG